MQQQTINTSNKTRFIRNEGYQNFYTELKEALSSCISFKMSVAFIRYSGLQIMLDTFQELASKGIPGKIITSTYLNATQPKALSALSRFPNIETRVYIPTQEKGFHSKGYIFQTPINTAIIIGSSNLTQCALKSNIEWNVRNNVQEPDDPFLLDVIKDFESQWQNPNTKSLTTDFINGYEAYLANYGRQHFQENTFTLQDDNTPIIPNSMQKKAIYNLDRLRKTNEKKALAIAATGSGKTYMAVFDALQTKPSRLLFIVHREDILVKAKASFDRIINKQKNTTGLFTGNTKNSSDYLFATIQTLQNHYELFAPDSFEYIIIDEAHHATSSSYQKVLQYFKPQFLLGLTATPDRSDSGDIYSVFDNNIAIEVRLRDALADELIAPFHYFGISEFSDINYEGIDLEDLAKVAKLLMINRRVDYIIEKMKFYDHDGGKRRCLGFCVTVEHALFMASEFNRRGYSSKALSSNHSIQERISTIQRFENEDDLLEFIFSVDLFNEGIDIPTINTILMLRPTDSSIVFTQQLGRGLRKVPNKEFVTVLDFIGNHRKSFLMAIALMGNKHFDKDSLKIAVSRSFADIPGSSHIHMDKIAREQILAQLEKEKFFSMKYLKEEYRDFKHQMGDRIPLLVDFLKVDGAIDPVTFINFSGTFLHFISRVENNQSFLTMLEDKDFESILKFFSNYLPIKRPHEMAIAAFLLNHENITLSDAHNIISSYIEEPSRESVEHTFSNLAGEFFDSGEKINYFGLLYERSNDCLSCSNSLKTFLLNKATRVWIEDCIQYALLRYEVEFGNHNYGYPFFKLYESYTMRETALLSNYTKTQSSFRGAGLLNIGKHYFIYVNLHKDEDVKESINYKDKFITRSVFQWESPNSTTQSSKRGQDLIRNMERGIHLHLFVRKFKEVEGQSQPFMYLGKVNTLTAENDKPILMHLSLEQELPGELYDDFIVKV